MWKKRSESLDVYSTKYYTITYDIKARNQVLKILTEVLFCFGIGYLLRYSITQNGNSIN